MGCGYVGDDADLGPGDGFELEEEEHQQDEEGAAAEDDGGREVVLSAGGFFGCAAFAFAQAVDGFDKCREDGGRGAEEGDEAGGGDCSGTHGADVGAPESGGGHLGDGDDAGVERGG